MRKLLEEQCRVSVEEALQVLGYSSPSTEAPEALPTCVEQVESEGSRLLDRLGQLMATYAVVRR